MQQLADSVQGIDHPQSAFIKAYSDPLLQQTSRILSMVSKTPDAIADLKATTIIHAKNQSEQAQRLENTLTAATSHVGSLSQIGINMSGAVSLHATAMKRCSKRLASLMQDMKKLFVL